MVKEVVELGPVHQRYLRASFSFPAGGGWQQAAHAAAVAGTQAFPSPTHTAPHQWWKVLLGSPKPGLSYSADLPEPAGKRKGLVFTKHRARVAKEDQQKCLCEQSGWSRNLKPHLQTRKYRLWETDLEMGQKVAIVFIYHCKDLPHPLTSPFLFQVGHPDLMFRQYFWISWNHYEVWISKSTEGLAGRFANVDRLGCRSGEWCGGKSPLYFFPLLLDHGVFFTNLSVM